MYIIESVDINTYMHTYTYKSESIICIQAIYIAKSAVNTVTMCMFGLVYMRTVYCLTMCSHTVN